MKFLILHRQDRHTERPDWNYYLCIYADGKNWVNSIVKSIYIYALELHKTQQVKSVQGALALVGQNCIMYWEMPEDADLDITTKEV